MRTMLIGAVILLLALTCLTGHGQDKKNDPVAKDFPKGTFALKLPDGAVWAVKVDGKDTFTVTRDGKEAVEGTYKVTKDEIEFTDEKGPLADKAEGPGTYKWKLDGDKVTFTRVKDKSEGRSGALTAGAWERKKE
jgi:hypothetical protein